ncbi:hypothetical protein MWU59_02675 [Flavobacteriaceae bacterium F08102]|nr:hypothetical protein [Flavobacteriaceae bacterium F08102]
MGKANTGAWSTSECRKLNINWLLRNNYIRKGFITRGQIEWTDNSSAGFECKCTKSEKWLRLYYTVTDIEGEKTDYDYKIHITTVPSNLGKGEVLYFVCPESAKRARILYSAYRYPKYVHRDWYLENHNVRIYYTTQQCAKRDYYNNRYHDLRKQVDKLENELFTKHRKPLYKGKPTKDFMKLYKLRKQMNHFDDMRNQVLIENCKKIGIYFNRF